MSGKESYLDQVYTLQSEADSPVFEVAISGARIATTALILIHGFGARRDSRGLFTDIAETTKDWALTLRGDFSSVNGNTSIALPFSEQVGRLQAIKDFCREELGVAEEVYIGHSQGWLPIALSQPTDKEVYALAPPLGRAYFEFIKTPGWSRRGSELNIEGESRLVRSDSSLTLVPRRFWDEFRALDNVTPLMEELADKNHLKIYFAGKDNVLGTQAAPDGVASETIEDANHDFIETARRVLIGKLISDLVQK